MVQTTQSSQGSSSTERGGKHLTADKRDKLIRTLAQDDYAEKFRDISFYDLGSDAKDKREHNEAVINEALNTLYQTRLSQLAPKENSLTLIKLNQAGVDLNVCPNYRLKPNQSDISDGQGLRPLEKKCKSKTSYRSKREYSDCEVQLKEAPCLLLERLADEEDKSWEQVFEELNRKNEEIRESYQGPTIIDR